MIELIVIIACIAYYLSRHPEITDKLRESFSQGKPKRKPGAQGEEQTVVDADGSTVHTARPRKPVDLKPLRRAVVTLLVLGLLAVIGFGSYYNVNEQENAVVTMFGEVIRTDTAGLHFKIPLLQRVRKVDITTHGTGIGYRVSDDGQSFTTDTDGIMITKDFNFIDIDFYMEYKVSDPVAYLYNSREPEQILKNIALASIRSTIINYNVDDAITTAKTQIQSEVREKMAEELAEQNIGLSVVNITVQDARAAHRGDHPGLQSRGDCQAGQGYGCQQCQQI